MKTHVVLKLAFLPVILLTLQSCFTAKNYVRPEVVEESRYRTDQLPQDSLSIADFSWQELFTDEYLVEYIEEGLDNNLDIRIALEQIRIAEAYYKQGRAGHFPQVTAGGQVTHQEASENSLTGAGSATQFDLSGTLSWEADIWGRIRSNARAMEASYLQTVAAHQAVKTELIANIASIYFQLLALDEQKQVTEASIANRESSLETTKALKESGYVTEAGVKQTEAQLHSSRALLINLETNIRFLENTFSILLGRAPGEIERGTLDQQEIQPEVSVGFPAELLRNRPDVIAAEYRLVNAFELTNAARSNFYPAVTLSASGGFQSTDLDQLLSANSLFANVIGSLTQPIFNRRAVRTEYEVSLSRQEQAYLDFRQSLLTASREVSDALYAYDAAGERIEVETLEYEAYQEATTYSEELLNNGLVNYLEVLTARESALNSRLTLINTRFEQMDSIIELYRALGGGWQ